MATAPFNSRLQAVLLFQHHQTTTPHAPIAASSIASRAEKQSPVKEKEQEPEQEENDKEEESEEEDDGEKH